MNRDDQSSGSRNLRNNSNMPAPLIAAIAVVIGLALGAFFASLLSYTSLPSGLSLTISLIVGFLGGAVFIQIFGWNIIARRRKSTPRPRVKKRVPRPDPHAIEATGNVLPDENLQPELPISIPADSVQTAIDPIYASPKTPNKDKAVKTKMIAGQTKSIHDTRPRGTTKAEITLVTDPQMDTQFLVVERWEKMGRIRFVDVIRMRSRRWQHVINTLEVDRGVLIDEAVLTRNDFRPTEDETKIYCYMRRSWWSHGPLQILALIFGLFGIIGGISGTVSAQVSLVWTALAALMFYVIWMLWNRTYVVLTNRRFTYRFNPPWPIPKVFHGVPRMKMQGANFDQGLIGRMLRFATIKSESAAAETDAWIRKGLKYITHFEELVMLLTSEVGVDTQSGL